MELYRAFLIKQEPFQTYHRITAILLPAGGWTIRRLTKQPFDFSWWPKNPYTQKQL